MTAPIDIDGIRERVRLGLLEDSDASQLLAHLDAETARLRQQVAQHQLALVQGALECAAEARAETVNALVQQLDNLRAQVESADAARLSSSQDNERMQNGLAETMGVADQMVRHIAIMEPVLAAAEVWVDRVTEICGGPPTEAVAGPEPVALYHAVVECRQSLAGSKS